MTPRCRGGGALFPCPSTAAGSPHPFRCRLRRRECLPALLFLLLLLNLHFFHGECLNVTSEIPAEPSTTTAAAPTSSSVAVPETKVGFAFPFYFPAALGPLLLGLYDVRYRINATLPTLSNLHPHVSLVPIFKRVGWTSAAYLLSVVDLIQQDRAQIVVAGIESQTCGVSAMASTALGAVYLGSRVCTSMTLSGFHNFVNMAPSDGQFAYVITKLSRLLGWKRIAVLYEDNVSGTCVCCACIF